MALPTKLRILFPSHRILTAVAHVTQGNLKICAPMEADEETFAVILYVCVAKVAYGTMRHYFLYMGLVVRTVRLAF